MEVGCVVKTNSSGSKCNKVSEKRYPPEKIISNLRCVTDSLTMLCIPNQPLPSAVKNKTNDVNTIRIYKQQIYKEAR